MFCQLKCFFLKTLLTPIYARASKITLRPLANCRNGVSSLVPRSSVGPYTRTLLCTISRPTRRWSGPLSTSAALSINSVEGSRPGHVCHVASSILARLRRESNPYKSMLPKLIHYRREPHRDIVHTSEEMRYVARAHGCVKNAPQRD